MIYELLSADMSKTKTVHQTIQTSYEKELKIIQQMKHTAQKEDPFVCDTTCRETVPHHV